MVLALHRVLFGMIVCLGVSSCQSVRFTKNPEAFIPVMPVPKKAISFALVLGSGGSRGLAHIGVLEVLEEEGIKPDLIVGCSAGAIVGALYASRPDSKWLKEILLPQKSANFLEFHLAHFPFALLSNTGLEQFLNEQLGNRRFQDLQIPFIAVATNLQTGKLYPFFTGPVVRPIMASSAIPGAFNPVELYDTYFVDGGVADPVPVQTARSLKAKTVVAVEVGQELSESPPSDLIGIVWRSLIINYTSLSKHNVRQADVALEIPIPEAGMFSDDRNEDFYALGRATAKAALPQIKKLLEANAAKKL